MAWIQGRLDGTSCVGQLCARRPAPAVRGRGLAPTAFKMSPLPGLNSQLLFDKSSLLHSGRDTCFLTPISADSWVLSPGRGGIFSAVGASPRLPGRSRFGGE